MMRFVAILVALYTASIITGCGSPEATNEVIKPAGETADPQQPKQKMEVMAKELPVEQFSGASLMMSSRKGEQKISMYTSKDDYAKIVAYYKDFVTTNRWSIITIDENPTESTVIACKDKTKMTVEVKPPQENVGAKVTTITVTTEPRQ
jgi:hypothetical protein